MSSWARRARLRWQQLSRRCAGGLVESARRNCGGAWRAAERAQALALANYASHADEEAKEQYWRRTPLTKPLALERVIEASTCLSGRF